MDRAFIRIINLLTKVFLSDAASYNLACDCVAASLQTAARRRKDQTADEPTPFESMQCIKNINYKWLDASGKEDPLHILCPR